MEGAAGDPGQVHPDGEEGLQGASLPQLEPRLLRDPLLLPPHQQPGPRAERVPQVGAAEGCGPSGQNTVNLLVPKRYFCTSI